MADKDQKLLELLQELQKEFETVARKKLKESGMEDDLRWIVDPSETARGKGACADQSGCTERCKPNICIDKGICEAKHLCGYRCRLYGEPCMAKCSSLCYSQPI